MKIQIKADLDDKHRLKVDQIKLNDLLSALPVGAVVLTVETYGGFREIRDFQKEYFRMRDIICRETGGDRDTVHTEIKKIVLPRIIDNELYLNDMILEFYNRIKEDNPDGEVLKEFKKLYLSTTWLNELGWKEFIEAFRIWAFTDQNIHV